MGSKTRFVRRDVDHVESAATDFAEVARSYVDWFDRTSSKDEVLADLTDLLSILGNLQVAATRLPPKINLPDDEAPTEESLDKAALLRRAARFVPFHDYSVVFDPFVFDESPVTAMLEDDLSDIYADLAEGLQLFNSRRFSEALWTWRFGYYSHWGRHAVHAQAAIWQYQSTGSER